MPSVVGWGEVVRILVWIRSGMANIWSDGGEMKRRRNATQRNAVNAVAQALAVSVLVWLNIRRYLFVVGEVEARGLTWTG